MSYSGSGDVTAPLQAVDIVVPIGANPPNTSTSGCEAADFTGFTAGNVALMQRGTCSFRVKADNAQAAGASAVVIFNEGQPASPTQPEDRTVVIQGTLGTPGVTIPVVGTSYAIGAELTEQTRAGAVTAHVSTATISETRTTKNVIADYKGGGDPTQTILVGSHLDSVPAGPGINDNGSGTATLLETAVQLGSAPPVANAVRFAFWGAEEEGLVGSTAYVRGLSEADRGKIALYLNLDMVGSPNSGYYVYDGDDSDKEGAGPGPAGSATLERVLVESLATAGVPAAGTDFDGRSDYGPFIEAGIASGGLFTGASEPMSAEDAQRWGGDANQPHDPCYHQACDRLDAIDRVALDRNVDAFANTMATFALSTEGLKAG
jgi:Zn-dependent M28 family amino/carboxypeptidase